MYHNGKYSFEYRGGYDGGAWSVTLRVDDLQVTKEAFYLRYAIFRANRAMDRVMRYRQICNAVKEACVDGDDEELASGVDSSTDSVA